MPSPRWNSADEVERAASRIELVGILALAVVFLFDLFALIFLTGHPWIKWGSTIALGILVVVEYIGWEIGNFARRMRRIEAEKQAEIDKERGEAIDELVNGQHYMEEEFREKLREVERMVTDPRYFADNRD